MTHLLPFLLLPVWLPPQIHITIQLSKLVLWPCLHNPFPWFLVIRAENSQPHQVMQSGEQMTAVSWHQASAHSGVFHLCSGHRFNSHNLTKSPGILTEHRLPEYLFWHCLHCLFLLLLFFSEKLEKFCFGNRQRLHQRTLQGLEKQLEHTDRALQHLALLQAAGTERSRKESFLQEEEKRKASQRLQFLKAQSLQKEELQAQRNERSFEQEKERLVRAISEMFFPYYRVFSSGTIQSISLSPVLYPI